VEENILFMKTSDETEIKIIKFKGDAAVMQAGSVFEIRGIVNKDSTISFGEFTKYDDEFDLGQYEQMCHHFHGMCRDLCIK